MYIIKPVIDYLVSRRKERIEQIKQQYIEYKQTLTCCKCGYSDYRALEFHHHKDDKKYEVASMPARDYSWTTIKKEIDKCIVLCACCHRIEHY